MSELNWIKFSELSGDPTKNWELLCRELVRRNYSRYGSFRSQNQQPGIEFQLDIELPSELGDASRHFGWQSRWYEIQPGRQIGKTRRKKIVDAIRKTEKHFPEITDWVLWTKNPLTPTDQEWFYEISTERLKLHLWTREEVKGLMTGDATVLRQTFFGDLILTAGKLRDLHETAVAPIKKRWDPQLHIEVATERQIKSVLVTKGTWPLVSELSEVLFARVESLASDAAGLDAPQLEILQSLCATLRRQAEQLQMLNVAIEGGSLNLAADIVERRIHPTISKLDANRLASLLRAMNHPASISLSAACWEIGKYYGVLNDVESAFRNNLVAVIGDAGFGKTFLGAQLTEPSDDFAGGILLLAKYLPKRGDFDDLTRRVSLGGKGIEQLLESVDAFGARNDLRIPVVIDGLNESENPRDWKDLLSTLQVLLRRFNNCVVIVTLRRAIADDVIPEGVQRHYLDGFQTEIDDAVTRYFERYKIDATDAHLPLRQFVSPLFLKLFCEATNPDRVQWVGVERIPRSLNAVFGRYRETVVKRVADALDMANEEIESALKRIGLELWKQNSRIIDFDTTKEILGDGARNWSGSLSRVLEEEGVIARDPHPPHISFLHIDSDSKNQVSAILYDAFAGFVIADAIMSEFDASSWSEWLRENADRLNKGSRNAHPMAEDILSALVGLFPGRHFEQVWKVAPESLRDSALMLTTQLEPEKVDSETVEMLIQRARVEKLFAHDLFKELTRTKASVGHPLNAYFLNRLLVKMPVAHRDLFWSEWLRQNRDWMLQELDQLEDDWECREDRNDADELNALWVSWMLTSSDREVRDQATRSLYWFGRSNPKLAFELMERMLDVDDPYVVERMLAFGYGVLMSLQRTVLENHDSIRELLRRFMTRYTSPGAISPTNHWRSREYIHGFFHFIEKFAEPVTTDEGVPPSNDLKLAAAPYIRAGDISQSYADSFDIKFETDSIGRILPGFNKYGERSEEFENVVLEVRGRVTELG